MLISQNQKTGKWETYHQLRPQAYKLYGPTDLDRLCQANNHRGYINTQEKEAKLANPLKFKLLQIFNCLYRREQVRAINYTGPI